MTVSCNKQKKLSSGINPENLDTTKVAQNDFYAYACGGWMKNNPLKDEYSRFGTFDVLGEMNKKRLNGLIKEIAEENQEQGSVGQKIADVYNLAMDSTKLNKDGINPLKPYLNKITSVKDKKELSSLLPELYMDGLANGFFHIYVDADPRNSVMNLLQTYQGGYALGEREYYLDNDEKDKEIRKKYQKHIAKMFHLFGYPENNSEKNAETVLLMETRLAKAAFDNVKLRDPIANYNKMSIADFEKMVPAINWDTYFKTLGISVKDISVGQIDHMKEVNKMIGDENIDDIKTFLEWQVINNSTSFLSDTVYMANFDFYGKVLSGKKAPTPRWKRAVGSVNGVLGEAVGQMYVKKYFPPENKERMVKLVKNLQQAFAERIKAQKWLGDSTKEIALDKLAAFHVKIGYPDKWRDYSSLQIKKDSYLANMIRANRFEMDYSLSYVNKPVDKDKWYMTPQTVNAYYNPTSNEICFPAAILQPPFFNMDADDAANYGAIGVVIGHEMTHGFDDQGSHFDKEGNLNEWWTKTDRENFDQRTKVMADYFDSIEVAPEVYANGKFTLGENIADHGGLEISFQAFKNATKNSPLENKDGFTPEQRFFLAYANVWAQNIRPEEILVRTKSDPHSLGKWRVDGALPQIEAWYKAFNVTEKSPMYIAPEKRVDIW